jgi:hypothetical protein
MKFSKLSFIGLLCGIMQFSAPASSAADEKPPTQSPTACVTHTTQARYIMGYDHLVHIDNACEKSVECTVSTDVNPQPQTVVVDAKSQQTVVTFKGSPARVFRANVDCQLRS